MSSCCFIVTLPAAGMMPISRYLKVLYSSLAKDSIIPSENYLMTYATYLLQWKKKTL